MLLECFTKILLDTSLTPHRYTLNHTPTHWPKQTAPTHPTTSNHTFTHGPNHTRPQTPLGHSLHSQHTVIPSVNQDHNQPAPTHPTTHITTHSLMDPTTHGLRHPSDTSLHSQHSHPISQSRPQSASSHHTHQHIHSWTQPHTASDTPQTLTAQSTQSSHQSVKTTISQPPLIPPHT